jgi:hypothetical protein
MTEAEWREYSLGGKMRRWLFPLFVVMWLAAGIAFWWQDDWWYYVGSGPERWPKFLAPWWEQLVVSVVVGFFFAGLVVGAASVICMLVLPRFALLTSQPENK